MRKTQILSKTIKRLRVSVRVRFSLFYLELTFTDLWFNMLHDFTLTDKYEDLMSDEHPPQQTDSLVPCIWKAVISKGTAICAVNYQNM